MASDFVYVFMLIMTSNKIHRLLLNFKLYLSITMFGYETKSVFVSD